jgi:hypothetical protein
MSRMRIIVNKKWKEKINVHIVEQKLYHKNGMELILQIVTSVENQLGRKVQR